MITSIFSFLLLFSFGTSKDFTVCPFIGHKDWITSDNKTCYLFATKSNKLNWNEAEEKCLSYNSRLISIHDNITNQLVSKFAKDSGWLGLNSLGKRGSYKWSDGTPYDYNNFEKQSHNSTKKPLNTNQLGRCVAFDVNNGKWDYQHCNDELEVYCQKTDFPVLTTTIPIGNCPQGWYEYANTKCIKIIDVNMTKYEAEAKCVSLDGGLVSIHSFEEQNFITALIFNKSSAWIGFEQLFKYHGRWTWNDQSIVTYTNWAINNPKEHNDSNFCSYLISSEIQAGNWISSSCTSKKQSVICQMDKNPEISERSQPAFESCKIPGYQNFTQYRNSCYLLSNEMESWDSAENKCRSLNSHLVSVLDSFEYAFTYYTQQFLMRDQIWIGFYAKNDNSSQVLFKWIDNWPNFVSFWAENQPFISNNWNKTCVYQNRKSGNWSTDSCEMKKYFMCKTTVNQKSKNNSKIGYCPEIISNVSKSSWTDIYEGSKYCYWFSVDYKRIKQTWTEALSQCHKRGGKLASIHSYNDLRLLSAKIRKSDYDTWIGLYNSSTTGAISWDDNSPVDFTYFDKEAIDTIKRKEDNCVSVRKSDLFWVFHNCSMSLNTFDYICEIEKVYETSNITKLTTKQTNSTLTTIKSQTNKTVITTSFTTKSVPTNKFTNRTSISTAKLITTNSLTTINTTNSSTLETTVNKTIKIRLTTVSSLTPINKSFTTQSNPTTQSINNTNSSITTVNKTSNTRFTKIIRSNSTLISVKTTMSAILTTSSTLNSTLVATESSQPNTGSKGLTTAAKIAISVLAFVVFIGFCSIIYIFKSNNIKFLDFFRRKPKSNDIALREKNI